MNRWFVFPLLPVIFCLALSVQPSNAAAIKAHVDATDLPRGLLTAEITLPVKSGMLDAYYPQWIEGVHGPNNPIQNVAGIEVITPDGESIAWFRHPEDIYHIQAEVPSGVRSVTVKTTYICNQSTTGSTGVDSYGNPHLGIICWNTCLLYPVGASIFDLEIDLTLQLPEGWSWGSSLQSKKETGSSIEFERTTLQEVMDSPVICGEHVRKYDITPEGRSKHFIHIASESKRVLDVDEKTIQKLRDLVEEAALLTGGKHDYDYHFLLVLSNNMPFIGLEHTRSSLNAVSENGLEDDEQLTKTGQLLAHEFGHRWCGKYHRPAGMAGDDYNTPKDTKLLWVYEGLDQYLGVVLAARSGLFATEKRTSFEGALRDGWMGIGRTLTSLMRQKGRKFMNLQDTAASSYVRRARSNHWTQLRRPQDYYFEGALLWFEIDAILRKETDGKVTLDDFNQRFLGRYDARKPLMPFTESELVTLLNGLHKYDWQSLIDDRVRSYREDLPLDMLSRVGYRLEYSPKPTDFDKDDSLTSIGARISGNGTIQTIIPGGLIDQAKLAEGDQIISVNGKKYSTARFKDAIAESPVNREIEFMLFKGDDLKTVVVPYADGPKYIDIVRNEDKPDLLEDILKPRRDLSSK
ncbi:MAG: PDZ domain-containing protein [Candidatus Hinthialibacter antarcticus]|nr:PDZ domain-containing protein [Candidatus Hinthialibacter antarcticus]